MTVRSLPAARRIHVGRAALWVVAALLFTLGWAAGVSVKAALWTWDALVLGFRDGRA